MRLVLITDHGPNGSGEAFRRQVARVSGETVIAVHAQEGRLPHCDAVVVAGREDGAEARLTSPGARWPVFEAVRAYAAAGAPLLAVGRGAVLVCRAGLVPGDVTRKAAGRAAVGLRPAQHLRVEGRPTPFTAAIPAGRVLHIGSAAPSFRYTIGAAAEFEARGQVIFRYADAAGGLLDIEGTDSGADAADPTVAGVSNTHGNVVALFPDALGADQPVAPAAGGDGDGVSAFSRQLFTALRLFLRARG
jgi:phosphoribosylformylglycinamidine (FGAM) synthase-like amidotransferase family enzyme